MEHHPLLKELLDVCAAHGVEPAKAYTTFDVFNELSLVRKFSDLKYSFNEELKLFYLSGKQEVTDETDGIYVPIMMNDETTPREMSKLQKILSPLKQQIYLYIRDRDSSSTCYCITSGLVKPDSPNTCKRKREIEGKKYQYEKMIQANRKLLYAKALRQKKADGSTTTKTDHESIDETVFETVRPNKV